MARVKLNRNDTDFMREYVQEGVERGETAEEIKRRRKELSEMFHCTLSQVSGAVAWKNKGGELSLEPLDLQESHNESYANTETISSTKGDGSPKNIYDNDPKNQWRNACYDYITKVCTDLNAEKAKFFCFCADDWLEVSQVTDRLGIKRENIWGAEFDSDLQEAANQNAKRLGTNFFAGDANQLFNDSDLEFDVAILDFKGHPNFEVIRRLPLTSKSIVIINTLRRRENAKYQRFLQESTVKGLKLDKPKNLTLDEAFLDLSEEVSDFAKANPQKLSEVTEDYYLNQIFDHTGCSNRRNWVLPSELSQLESYSLQFLSHNEVQDPGMLIIRALHCVGPDVSAGMWNALVKVFPDESEAWNEVVDVASDIRDCICMQYPEVSNVESYSYINPNGNSPYISCMAQLDRDIGFFLRYKDIAQYYVKSILAFFDAETTTEPVKIRLENMQRKPASRNDSFSSLRYVTYLGTTKRAVLKLSKIMNGAKEMNKLNSTSNE